MQLDRKKRGKKEKVNKYKIINLLSKDFKMQSCFVSHKEPFNMLLFPHISAHLTITAPTSQLIFGNNMHKSKAQSKKREKS